MTYLSVYQPDSLQEVSFWPRFDPWTPSKNKNESNRPETNCWLVSWLVNEPATIMIIDWLLNNLIQIKNAKHDPIPAFPLWRLFFLSVFRINFYKNVIGFWTVGWAEQEIFGCQLRKQWWAFLAYFRQAMQTGIKYLVRLILFLVVVPYLFLSLFCFRLILLT